MNSKRKMRHQLKVPRRAQGGGIIAQCLIGYEIADDGKHCRFSFLDGEGLERSLVLSLERMRQLFLTLRDVLEHRAGIRERQQNPQDCHHVASWTAESCSDSESVILTFVTPDDDAPIAVQIGESELVILAEAVVEHELVAYPEGLRFN
jgi:hypothetical protein